MMDNVTKNNLYSIGQAPCSDDSLLEYIRAACASDQGVYFQRSDVFLSVLARLRDEIFEKERVEELLEDAITKKAKIARGYSQLTEENLAWQAEVERLRDVLERVLDGLREMKVDSDSLSPDLSNLKDIPWGDFLKRKDPDNG